MKKEAQEIISKYLTEEGSRPIILKNLSENEKAWFNSFCRFAETIAPHLSDDVKPDFLKIELSEMQKKELDEMREQLVSAGRVTRSPVPFKVQEAVIKYIRSYNDVIIAPCDKACIENALATPCMGVKGTDVSIKARRLLIEELKPFFEITR